MSNLNNYEGIHSCLLNPCIIPVFIPAPVSDRISRIIDEERAHNTAIRINRKQSTVARTEMLNSTKELLENFYRPWNKMLAKYLGDDRYLFE